MKNYSFTEEEIKDFANKVYEIGCTGYLDLKDSICNKLVDELLQSRKVLNEYNVNTYYSQETMANDPPLLRQDNSLILSDSSIIRQDNTIILSNF